MGGRWKIFEIGAAGLNFVSVRRRMRGKWAGQDKIFGSRFHLLSKEGVL